MKLQTEDSQIRRRSNSSILYLFIPWLNYAFFLFQARGAYIAIKNYYQFNKKLPNPVRTAMIAFKYALYGSIGATVIYLLLMIPDWNSFAPVGVYYLGLLSDLIGGALGLQASNWFFGDLAQTLLQTKYSFKALAASYCYFLGTYLIFGFAGSFLAIYNVKSDLRRNLMEYDEN